MHHDVEPWEGGPSLGQVCDDQVGDPLGFVGWLPARDPEDLMPSRRCTRSEMTAHEAVDSRDGDAEAHVSGRRR
ncbi:hypothetical protein GCM10027426_25220 [Microbacterium lacusdiani]